MLKKLSTLIILILLLFPLLISILCIRLKNKNNLLISENKILSEKNELLALNLAPMCNFGRCPVYGSADTDNDGDTESIVEVPIAMTKGAGEIWIIDKGEVVFRHEGGANIGYKVPGYDMEGDGGGIFISYAKEYDETGLSPKIWATEEWRYENGSYVLKDITFKEQNISK